MQEYGLQEETRERDRETERFLYSLTYSRVSAARTGRTEDGSGKEEEEVRRTSDRDDREQGENRVRAVSHEPGQSQSRVSKERPQQGGKGGK